MQIHLRIGSLPAATLVECWAKQHENYWVNAVNSNQGEENVNSNSILLLTVQELGGGGDGTPNQKTRTV